MARDSEKVKVKEGGIGTIRIGATGKVSALMMQELESNNIKTSSKKPGVKSQRIQTAPVSIDCGRSAKRLQRNRMVSSNGHETAPRKKKDMKHVSQQIPMLDSEDLCIDKTPVRGDQQRKKVTRRIVETVDLKCGKNDGDWSATPIGNQLKRLSFSKISG